MNWYKKAQSVEDFTNLGYLQREKPESAMLNAQQFHAGLWTHLLEHVGDLTHRMTEYINNGGGYGASKEKIDRSISYLINGFLGRSFEEAHEENITNNAKRLNISEEEYRNNIKEYGEKYSQEHEQLAVYNEAQQRARDAAVSLGRFDFKSALENLTWLKNLADQGEQVWDMKVLEGLRSSVSFASSNN